MPRLFAANFDFEHQLEPRPMARSSEPIERINRELAAAWVAIAGDGDFIWMPFDVEPEFFSRLVEAGLPAVHPLKHAGDVPRDVEVCPWGWSPQIRQWAQSQGWHVPAPSPDVVAEVNSRAFSAQLERQDQIEIDGATEIRSVDQLLSAIAAMPAGYDDWVVKANFSMSARERIVGRGRSLEVAATNWVDKRCKAGDSLFFEPWVERLEEVGLQFTIPQDGPVQFEGCTPLLTHLSGQYRGSRFAGESVDETRWQPAIDIGFDTAQTLQGKGYFGPLGIDAVHYQDAGDNGRLRPLQDINARYTMGRLALGFRRLLGPGELGTWLHLVWPHDEPNNSRRWFDHLVNHLPAGVRVIPTTPFSIENHPTHHGSLALIASSQEALTAAEQTVLSSER